MFRRRHAEVDKNAATGARVEATPPPPLAGPVVFPAGSPGDTPTVQLQTKHQQQIQFLPAHQQQKKEKEKKEKEKKEKEEELRRKKEEEEKEKKKKEELRRKKEEEEKKKEEELRRKKEEEEKKKEEELRRKKEEEEKKKEEELRRKKEEEEKKKEEELRRKEEEEKEKKEKEEELRRKKEEEEKEKKKEELRRQKEEEEKEKKEKEEELRKKKQEEEEGKKEEGERRGSGRRGEGGGGGWLQKHKVLIMSNTLVAAIAFLGAMVGVHVIVERQSDKLVERASERVISKGNLLVVGSEGGEGQRTPQEVLVTYMNHKVMPALRAEAKQVTNYTVKISRVEYACLRSDEIQWKMFERDLKKAEEKLQKEYKEKLDKEMAAFKLKYQKEMNSTKDHFKGEMEKTKTDVSTTLGNAETTMNTRIQGEVNSQTQGLRTAVEEIAKTLGLQDVVLREKGYLQIDSIGPVLVVMAVMEVLLGLCICLLCTRNLSHNRPPPPPTPPHHHNNSQQQRRQQGTGRIANGGGDTFQPLINTNNSNLLCLCFRDADRNLSQRLGTVLKDQCDSGGSGGSSLNHHSSRHRHRGRQEEMFVNTFVVNSMADVGSIPSCRAALVFVDPDEREMIVEDERHHIGQGLRRHAIQRLLDSGVEVFIIIFNDKRSANLTSDQLYNVKLGQVDDHAQLIRLKRLHRVVSIKDNFHPHQASLIMGELRKVFD